MALLPTPFLRMWAQRIRTQVTRWMLTSLRMWRLLTRTRRMRWMLTSRLMPALRIRIRRMRWILTYRRTLPPRILTQVINGRVRRMPPAGTLDSTPPLK